MLTGSGKFDAIGQEKSQSCPAFVVVMIQQLVSRVVGCGASVAEVYARAGSPRHARIRD